MIFLLNYVRLSFYSKSHVFSLQSLINTVIRMWKYHKLKNHKLKKKTRSLCLWSTIKVLINTEYLMKFYYRVSGAGSLFLESVLQEFSYFIEKEFGKTVNWWKIATAVVEFLTLLWFYTDLLSNFVQFWNFMLWTQKCTNSSFHVNKVNHKVPKMTMFNTVIRILKYHKLKKKILN